MVKQSCTSASDRSLTVQPAACSDCVHARRGPSKLAALREPSGNQSLTCARARTATARGKSAARPSSTITSAAAPSETSEQSVLRSGAAIIGFLSLTVLQNSKPRSRRMWAHGLATPLAWFFAAMRASVAEWSPNSAKYDLAISPKMPGKPPGGLPSSPE